MNKEATASPQKSWMEISEPLLLPAKPVVSVLMLAYNHGLYLTEAIEGVLAQITDFPYEIIIGEDCSLDNTRDIALNYQRLFPGVVRVVFSDNNIGMHSNFIRILNLCRGEFIAFCEGDDYWIDPSKLQVQVDYLKSRPNIGLCFHSVYSKSMEKLGTQEVTCFHGDKNIEMPVSELVKNGGGFCPSCSLVMRSDKIINDSWIMQDLPVADYFIQVLSAIPNGAGYIGRVMGVYRRDVPGSFSSGMKLWEKRLKISENLLEKLDEFDLYLEGEFSDEINNYKKKIQFSIMSDTEISKIDKIKFYNKCGVSLGLVERFKISGMIFFPDPYAFLIGVRNYYRRSRAN